jgi:hypothetical protein
MAVSDRYQKGPRFGQLLAQPSSTQDEIHNLYDVWYEILRHFFNTKVGCKSDRLRAVAGLIANFVERTKWESMMGLWKLFIFQE